MADMHRITGAGRTGTWALNFVIVVLLCFASDIFSGSPKVVSVYVDQGTITVFPDSCTGVIVCQLADDDDDSLIISIQISSDGGSNWMVPFKSNTIKRNTPSTTASITGLYGTVTGVVYGMVSIRATPNYPKSLKIIGIT